MTPEENADSLASAVSQPDTIQKLKQRALIFLTRLQLQTTLQKDYEK